MSADDMTTIRILTDTGTRIAIEGLGDEKIDEYKQGFAANAPGATLSFELAADRWWLFPLNRVVAMQCLPDEPHDLDHLTDDERAELLARRR